jgi:hypothetical protein
MSWVITGTQKILPAAAEYVDRIQKADGQALEQAVYEAILEFAEWRIPYGGACTLLSGPRTLAGALVPMVGPALTGNNLVTGDYNRRRILLDGTTKSLSYGFSNTNALSGTQNNAHAYAALLEQCVGAGNSRIFESGPESSIATNGRTHLRLGGASANMVASCNSSLVAGLAIEVNGAWPAGLSGVNRNDSAFFRRVGSNIVDLEVTSASAAPNANNNWCWGGSTPGNNLMPGPFTLVSVGQFIPFSDFRVRYEKLMTDLAAAGL